MQEFTVTKTGMRRKQLFIMSAVEQVVHSYNQFKTRYSSRNNIYLIYKNMPLLQIISKSSVSCGRDFLMKFLFFAVKGMGKEYAAGIKNGFSISMKNKKVPFRMKHLPNYCKIQLELWINIVPQISGHNADITGLYGILIQYTVKDIVDFREQLV